MIRYFVVLKIRTFWLFKQEPIDSILIFTCSGVSSANASKLYENKDKSHSGQALRWVAERNRNKSMTVRKFGNEIFGTWLWENSRRWHHSDFKIYLYCPAPISRSAQPAVKHIKCIQNTLYSCIYVTRITHGCFVK